MFSPDVLAAFRAMLGQATAKSKGDADLLAKCYGELEAAEAEHPGPVVVGNGPPQEAE